jgi:hypothetical protein
MMTGIKYHLFKLRRFDNSLIDRNAFLIIKIRVRLMIFLYSKRFMEQPCFRKCNLFYRMKRKYCYLKKIKLNL